MFGISDIVLSLIIINICLISMNSDGRTTSNIVDLKLVRCQEEIFNMVHCITKPVKCLSHTFFSCLTKTDNVLHSHTSLVFLTPHCGIIARFGQW